MSWLLESLKPRRVSSSRSVRSSGRSRSGRISRVKDSATSLRSSAKKVETDPSIHGEGKKIDMWFRCVFNRQSKCKGKRTLTIRCITSNTYVLHCAIWYHLYNFKNVKNAHGRVLLVLVKF